MQSKFSGTSNSEYQPCNNRGIIHYPVYEDQAPLSSVDDSRHPTTQAAPAVVSATASRSTSITAILPPSGAANSRHPSTIHHHNHHNHHLGLRFSAADSRRGARQRMSNRPSTYRVTPWVASRPPNDGVHSWRETRNAPESAEAGTAVWRGVNTGRLVYHTPIEGTCRMMRR